MANGTPDHRGFHWCAIRFRTLDLPIKELRHADSPTWNDSTSNALSGFPAAPCGTAGMWYLCQYLASSTVSAWKRRGAR